PEGFSLTPPHDILGKKTGSFLPKGPNSQVLLDMMIRSFNILKKHPVNIGRINRGLKPANSIWLWGEGKKPCVPPFSLKYNLKGSVICAVDLIKGLGISSGLKIVHVEGATGNFHTNYKGKAEAALRELDNGRDFVYIHVEAPDECGHRCEIHNKIKSIELIDEQVVGRLLEGLKSFSRYRMLILPDHATPLSLRTHVSDPVPFLLYDSSHEEKLAAKVRPFDEVQAKNTGVFVEHGHELMDYLTGKKAF
ncbi:MAG: phosphoglycerate mutase, partial [Clostridiaceae bacterium]|nr:phosphoglycerate mutase [Clostridiaceae bacterium]